MRKRRMCAVLPALALGLECLPWGAVRCIALPGSDGSVGHFRELYSYFAFMPFGWGNFAPLVTAAGTCAALLMLAVYILTGRGGWAKAGRGTLAACAVISLGPLLLGLRYVSAVGCLVTLALAGGALVTGRVLRGQDSRCAGVQTERPR